MSHLHKPITQVCIRWIVILGFQGTAMVLGIPIFLPFAEGMAYEEYHQVSHFSKRS